MSALTSYAMLLLVFVVCSSFTLVNSALHKDDAKRLVLEEQVGESIYAAYRSLLLNPLSATEGLLSPISQQCLTDLKNIKNNSKKLFTYIDAAGKPRSGFERGNLFWLGSYSGCQVLSDSKYCLSEIKLDYPSQNLTIGGITWGACFPKSCSVEDLYFAINFIILPEVYKITGVVIKYPGSFCPSGPTYTTGVKVTLVFSGILVLFCLIGTVIDLVIEERKELMSAKRLLKTNGGVSETVQAEHPGDEHTQNSSNPDDQTFLVPPNRTFLQRKKLLFSLLEIIRDFFLCFSLVRNSKKIFNTNVSSTAITCINGIRVISMSWVVLGHTFLLFSLIPIVDNRMGALEDSQLFSIMPVINGFYSVDSFFFLSGLLVAYTCFRKLEKSGGIFKFNWFLFYFHRFWRLTPTLMAVVLISVNLKRFLAEGPIWYSQYEDKLCKEYWWTNLLYINNFHPKRLGDECVGQSWYLANDMQFFVITPPLLMLMYKFRWRGVIGPGILLAASTAAIACIIGNWDLDPFSSLRYSRHKTPEQGKKNEEYNDYVYTKPWCRAQPYLVGFVLGYYIYRSSQHYYNPRRRLAVFWLVTVVGWAIAAALGMWLVYGPHKYIVNGADEWPLGWRVVYGMLERLLWSLVLAWVTYACHFGGGSLVQKFLSAKFWIPLSRLTFSVYLIHLIEIVVMLVGAQETLHYDFFNVTYYFISATVLSFAAAYILAVTIEFPCANLELLVINLLRGTRRQIRL